MKRFIAFGFAILLACNGSNAQENATNKNAKRKADIARADAVRVEVAVVGESSSPSMTLTCAVTSSLHAGVGCRRSRLASPPRSPSSGPGPVTLGARAEPGLDWLRIIGGRGWGGNGGLGRVFRHPVTGSLPRNRPRNRVVISYALPHRLRGAGQTGFPPSSCVQSSDDRIA